VVALQIRDAAKALALTEAIAAECGPGASVSVDGETTRWEWLLVRGEHFCPPLVLTKTHLLFGTESESVLEAARRIGRGGPTLETDPRYVAAIQGAPAQDSARFYFDATNFAEDFPQQSGVSLSDGSGRMVKKKMAIVRQLHPGVITVRPVGKGWMVESTLGVRCNAVLNQMLHYRHGR
jgi:hypothetical protein